MAPELINQTASWKWQDIYKVYKILGGILKSYEDIKSRIDIPQTIDINNTDADNVFILRFNNDIARIDRQLTILDMEIARRNNLVGVMG